MDAIEELIKNERLTEYTRKERRGKPERKASVYHVTPHIRLINLLNYL